MTRTLYGFVIRGSDTLSEAICLRCFQTECQGLPESDILLRVDGSAEVLECETCHLALHESYRRLLDRERSESLEIR